MTKRQLELPAETQAAIDETIEYVDERLSGEDTAAAVAEILADLFGDSEAYERYRNGESLAPMTRLRVRSYDPRHALVETEHWVRSVAVVEQRRVRAAVPADDRGPSVCGGGRRAAAVRRDQDPVWSQRPYG